MEKLSLPYEVWRAVVGYEGYYEVSNWGRVRSLPRMTARGMMGGQILKPVKNKDGYLQVNLYKDGKRQNLKVHRLVGMAFPDMVDWTEKAKGKTFDELEINHKSQNREINHVDNLGWMTREENNNYGTHNESVAKANTNGKMSKPVAQKTKDGVLIKIWPSVHEVTRQTGWCFKNISACCLGKKKTAYGFLWSYTKKAESVQPSASSLSSFLSSSSLRLIRSSIWLSNFISLLSNEPRIPTILPAKTNTLPLAEMTEGCISPLGSIKRLATSMKHPTTDRLTAQI